MIGDLGFDDAGRAKQPEMIAFAMNAVRSPDEGRCHECLTRDCFGACLGTQLTQTAIAEPMRDQCGIERRRHQRRVRESGRFTEAHATDMLVARYSFSGVSIHQ